MTAILKEKNNRWRVRDRMLNIDEVYDSHADAQARADWCNSQKIITMGNIKPEPARNFCTSSPWCNEDCCRCDKWAIEEEKLLANKIIDAKH